MTLYFCLDSGSRDRRVADLKRSALGNQKHFLKVQGVPSLDRKGLYSYRIALLDTILFATGLNYGVIYQFFTPSLFWRHQYRQSDSLRQGWVLVQYM